MITEREALTDEQAYRLANEVMAQWPVPTISMYAAMVRAGYRAALATPAQGTLPTQEWVTRATSQSTPGDDVPVGSAPAQGEPQPVIWCAPGWRAHPAPDAFSLTQTERHTIPLFDDTAIDALRTIWIKHWMLTRYSRNGLSGITCGSGKELTMNDLRKLAEAATPGPYFVALDEATECEPHRNSGLSLVDTGRAGDWPIARLCETQSANWIAATDPQTILTLLDRVESSERRAEYWKAEHNAGNAVIEGVDTDAVSALRNVTEELVLAGFPGGDRVAMFASLRELVAERDRLHTEFVRECDDADKICRALNLPGSWRTDGGSLHLPHILDAIAALRAERDKWKQQATDDCESLQAERVERDALLDEAVYTMRMLQAEKCPSCYGGGTTPYGDQCEWCFRRDADCAHLKAAIDAAIAALRAENERQAREIAELKSERDEAQRTGVATANYWMERAELAEDQRERTRDVWATRAERAEAECEKLREVVKAADAMREWCDPISEPHRIVRINYDAARAKVKK